MSKTLVIAATVCALLTVGLAGITTANRAVDSDKPAMMVSPSTIVLAKIGAITVHTNIPASTVVPGSLELEGVPPYAVGIDDCGHIMAKFALADLGLESGMTVLTLTGALTDGSTFSAKDGVRVK